MQKGEWDKIEADKALIWGYKENESYSTVFSCLLYRFEKFTLFLFKPALNLIHRSTCNHFAVPHTQASQLSVKNELPWSENISDIYFSQSRSHCRWDLTRRLTHKFLCVYMGACMRVVHLISQYSQQIKLMQSTKSEELFITSGRRYQL